MTGTGRLNRRPGHVCCPGPSATIRITGPDVMPITVRPIRQGESSFCEHVLRTLPSWFGIESAIVHYVERTESLPTWIVEVDAKPAGFLTLVLHSVHAAEIYCMAVLPEWHRRGLGRAMIEFIESHLRSNGVSFLQVKTLSPARENRHYAMTRCFYESLGFVSLEEFPDLWPGNPCRQYVKCLDH